MSKSNGRRAVITWPFVHLATSHSPVINLDKTTNGVIQDVESAKQRSAAAAAPRSNGHFAINAS